MLLVKDNRPKAHRKLFPVYFKCPEKVILEYTSVVYTKVCGYMVLYNVEYTIHLIYSQDSVQHCTYSGSI